MVRNLIAGVAALSLVATPALAQSAVTASPAAKLSLKNAVPAGARASTTAGKSKLAGSGLVVALIAAAAVVVGIVVIADDNDSDSN